MTFLQLLAKAANLAGPELLAMLRKIATDLPDFAPLAEKWIAALEATVTPQALAVLGSSVLHELSDVAQGKLDGRAHPSDLG